MNGRLDLSDLFFSGDGRVDRVPFIAASAVLVLLLAAYQRLVAGHPAVHWTTGLFAYGFLVFASACVLSKRLHDRGRSGWWSLVIMICFAGVWPYPASVKDWLATAVLVWAFVELALMPGQPWPNRFGARMAPLDPGESAQTPA